MTEQYSKEELYNIMAGDVHAAKIELDRARMWRESVPTYERAWWRVRCRELRAQLTSLRADLRACLKKGVVAKPEGFDLEV